MITMYRPGGSVLHRLPAGPKLLAIMALALVISLIPTDPWLLTGMAAVVTGCYLLAGSGLSELGRQLHDVRWLIVVMLVPQALFLSLPAATANIVRVVAVVLLAALVTRTTRTADLIDAIEYALRPLRRVGVNPSKAPLMLSMTISTVPVIAGFAQQIRAARLARGVPARPLTFVVPLLVMSLKHADELADALTARGVD